MVALFVALMVASAGVALLPALANIAAPFVCPNGYAASGVVSKTSHPGAGRTRTTSTLYCIDGTGRRLAANSLAAAGVILVLFFPPSWLAIWLLVRRPRSTGQEWSSGLDP
jgi:hypothetical protein